MSTELKIKVNYDKLTTLRTELLNSKQQIVLSENTAQIGQLQGDAKLAWDEIIASENIPQLSGITVELREILASDERFGTAERRLIKLVQDLNPEYLERCSSKESFKPPFNDEGHGKPVRMHRANYGAMPKQEQEIFYDANEEFYFDASTESSPVLVGSVSEDEDDIPSRQFDNPLYKMQGALITENWNYFRVLLPATLGSLVLAYIFFETKAEDFQDNVKDEFGRTFGDIVVEILAWSAISTNMLFYANAGYKLALETLKQWSQVALGKYNWLVTKLGVKADNGWRTKFLLRVVIPITGLIGAGATLGHALQMIDHPAWKQVFSDFYNGIPSTWGVVGTWIFTKNIIWPVLQWLFNKCTQGNTRETDYESIPDAVQKLEALVEVIKAMTVGDISQFTKQKVTSKESQVLKKLLRLIQDAKTNKDDVKETVKNIFTGQANDSLTEDEISTLFDLIAKIPKPAVTEVMSKTTQAILMASCTAICAPTYIGLSWSAFDKFPVLSSTITIPAYFGKAAAFSWALTEEPFVKGGIRKFLRNPNLASGLQNAPTGFKTFSYVLIIAFAIDGLFSWVVPANATLVNSHSGWATLLTSASCAFYNVISTFPFLAVLLVKGAVGVGGRNYANGAIANTALAEKVRDQLVEVLEALQEPLNTSDANTNARLQKVMQKLDDIYNQITEKKPLSDPESNFRCLPCCS